MLYTIALYFTLNLNLGIKSSVLSLTKKNQVLGWLVSLLIDRLAGGKQEVCSNVCEIILNKAISKKEDRNPIKTICVKVLVASAMKGKRMGGIWMEKLVT